MSEVYFPPTKENNRINEGYQGEDEFAVVETNLAQRFPIYKNGKHLSSFSREKNEDGDYSTNFSMNVDTQVTGDEDLNDERFSEYLDWLKKTSPNAKIIDYKNINKQ